MDRKCIIEKYTDDKLKRDLTHYVSSSLRYLLGRFPDDLAKDKAARDIVDNLSKEKLDELRLIYDLPKLSISVSYTTGFWEATSSSSLPRSRSGDDPGPW